MSADKRKQYELAIAALLHDIGKFKQRAYGGKEEYLLRETKNLDAILLPLTEDDRYSHRHALWTYDFFMSDFKNVIEKANNDFLFSLNIEKIAKLSAAHHRPDNDAEKIISLADRYSAGNDRAYKSTYHRGAYLATPLRSVFSSYKLGKDDDWQTEKSLYSYALKPISAPDAMFPVKQLNISTEDYKALYDKFLNSFSLSISEIHDYEALLLKLKDLLYEFTWCIPSATNDYLNDISLYDHSVTTMAIAVALLNGDEKQDTIGICAFCVSGIQSFIFQSKYASFKNAAKIFRGRSFIISAFSAAMKKLICDRLGIIPFVDIRDAGGGMTLLLPSSNEIRKQLDEIQAECEKYLLLKYYGTLSFCFYYKQGVSPLVFGKDKYIDFSKSISNALALSKSRKFSHVIAEGLNPVLPLDGGKDVCSACGKHGVASDSFCETCKNELDLGAKIPQGNYFSISNQDGDYEILPDIFLKIDSEEKYLNPVDLIWSLNPNDTRWPLWRLNNYTPNCDFSAIADSAVSEEGRGKPFLSYIKIDVDNLGKLVSSGLPKSEYSISRFTTFSRSLHYFFNSYMHRLLEEEFPYVYTVLSGGDDLFVIAPWNQSLSLVKRIKDAFGIFCCNNADLHFSAGIAIARPKEPFALINIRANEALDKRAKEYEGKNAIAYMDSVFSLGELDSFILECNRFKEYVRIDDDESKPITMGFLYRLYQYATDRQYGSSIEKQYGVFSKIHYDIARNLATEKKEYQEKYTEVADYILNRFNNYKSENDLNKFRLMLIQIIYECRKTNQEEIKWLLN